MHPVLVLFLLGQIQLFATGFFLPRSQDDDMVIVNRSGSMSQQLRALAALWRTQVWFLVPGAGSLQPPLTLVPRDLVPSSGLYGAPTHAFM